MSQPIISQSTIITVEDYLTQIEEIRDELLDFLKSKDFRPKLNMPIVDTPLLSDSEEEKIYELVEKLSDPSYKAISTLEDDLRDVERLAWVEFWDQFPILFFDEVFNQWWGNWDEVFHWTFAELFTKLSYIEPAIEEVRDYLDEWSI